jgi:hypothetical protein
MIAEDRRLDEVRDDGRIAVSYGNYQLHSHRCVRNYTRG